MAWLIEEMLKKFEHSPDLGKLLVTNLEVLLQADMKAEAKEFMEYCITGKIYFFLNLIAICQVNVWHQYNYAIYTVAQSIECLLD